MACQLQESANGARNDDITKTNSCIMDYHQPTPSTILRYNKREYPLPSRSRNEECGWAHLEYVLNMKRIAKGKKGTKETEVKL